jgi:hypothetical protein
VMPPGEAQARRAAQSLPAHVTGTFDLIREH